MSKTQHQMRKESHTYPAGAIRIIAVWVFSVILLWNKANADSIVLSDTASAYSLNIQHTKFDLLNCDIINVLGKTKAPGQTYLFSFKIFGAGSELETSKIQNEGLKKFILEEAKKYNGVTNLYELESKLCKNGLEISIDTVFLLYKENCYLITNNIQLTVLRIRSDDKDRIACGRLVSEKKRDMQKRTIFLVQQGEENLQAINKGKDTLIIQGKSKARDESGFEYTFISETGIIALKQHPYLTAEKDKLILRTVLSKFDWNYTGPYLSFTQYKSIEGDNN